ncbi:MAG: oligosaccharide flippase family protein [Planctomycetota bacterium]
MERARGTFGAIPARVLSSAGWLVAGRLFGASCTVVTLYVTSQHLTEGAFGRLTFWLAVFLVLDGLVDFGAGQVAVQRSSASPERLPGLLVTARRARLAMAALVVALVATTALSVEGADAPFLCVAALYQVSHVLELSTLGWRNAIRWRSPVLVRAGASFASLVFVLALRSTGESRPLAYLLAIAVGSTLGNVALHTFGRRGLPSTSGATPEPLAGFLRASVPIGAAAVCQQLYFHVDHVFVRALSGDDAVGHYGVAVRVMSLAIMGGVFASTAALPWLSRAEENGRLLVAARALCLGTAAVGAAGALVLWPLRETILGAFGAGFLEAEAALGWLLVAGALVHVGAPLLTAVVAAGAGGAVLGIAAGGLAINLAGNAWLVPAHGMTGAAAATVATEAWVAAAALGFLLRRRPARADVLRTPR